MKDHNYYVYLTTNKNKTVLYTGVTGALVKRLREHLENAKSMLNPAIAREKQIKGWTRAKKEALIKATNPEMHFLNNELLGLVPADD